MKNTGRKTALITTIIGIFICSYLTISVNAQRSKQIELDRLSEKGFREFQAGQNDAAIKTFT